MEPDREALEQALDYRFRDRSLLMRALTHSSRANDAAPGESPQDNERLEFLGDSVLGWLVSEWLYTKYPDFNEGELSALKNRLVSADHLVASAQRLDLGGHLQLSRGEESAGGRSKRRLLANTFEAVLAAIYLDGGPNAARDIVLRYAIPSDAELETLAGASPPFDFRAQLEKISRERNLPRPEYALKGESGPGHARTFTVEVKMGPGVRASAEGSSKKIAAHNAAREAYLRTIAEGMV